MARTLTSLYGKTSFPGGDEIFGLR